MRLALLLMVLAAGLRAETGALTIHMILHAIGEERYQIEPSEGGLTLHSTFEYSDRGNKRTTTAVMRLTTGYTPESLKIEERPSSIELQAGSATVQEDAASRTFTVPSRYFAIFGPSPFAVQMVMMRYWKAQG